jgi:hypothetical protein
MKKKALKKQMTDTRSRQSIEKQKEKLTQLQKNKETERKK